MSDNKHRRALLAFIVIFLVLIIILETLGAFIFSDNAYSNKTVSALVRIVGVLLCLCVITYCSYTRILKINISALPRNILFTLPCLIIAINNFPIIPFLMGKASITASNFDLLLFFVECLSVGAFEELAFRGCIFMRILERKRKSIKDIFAAVMISSSIFGLVHLMNIFLGADPLSTVLQIGYSFLIGAMCSIVLIETGSIWYAVILHAVYNFSGGVVSELGYGTVWDTASIILTFVLSVLVAVYMIVALIKYDVMKTEKLFAKPCKNTDLK